MGRVKKKKEIGIKGAYVPRTRAIKKLQITLPEFRRLCIFKGITPLAPHKKVKQKSKVFYSSKDVNFLMHEPLVDKFREYKVLKHKYKRREGRKQLEWAKDIDRQMRLSRYTLDKIIKERYPTFMDALRDLDDTLCTVALFAHSSGEKISAEDKMECQKLLREWEFAVARMHALRKTFLSIKGIYYQVTHALSIANANRVLIREFQAEIKSVSITWLVPYTHLNVAAEKNSGANFFVLNTFLELHMALLRFINYRLYTGSINLKYPPVFDDHHDDYGESFYLLGEDENMVQDQKETQVKSREIEVKEVKEVKEAEEIEESEEITEMRKKLGIEDKADSTLIFSGRKVFINRECPIHSLEFVLRAFGAEVGMESPLSKFKVDDKDITLHIMDRPAPEKYLGRKYVQPQWVYDSVNCLRPIPPEEYAVGQKIPPHLSPFSKEGEGYYVPKRAVELHPMRYEDYDAKVADQADIDELEMLKPILSKREAKVVKSVQRRKRNKIREAEKLRKRRKVVEKGDTDEQ